MKFGHCEKAIAIFLAGQIPYLISFYILANFVNDSFLILLLMLFGIFISFIAIIWLPLNIYKFRNRAMIDETAPEEVKVIRVTRDGIIIPMVAPKGMFGKIETMIYGKAADFNDSGDFPLRTLDGSPAVIVYDMINEVIDLRRSVAHKFMRLHVKNGTDGYKHAKKQRKVEGYEKQE